MEQLAPGSFFMGGKPTDGKFVRLVSEHIAVNWKDDVKRANQYLNLVGKGLKERFEPKGWQ